MIKLDSIWVIIEEGTLVFLINLFMEEQICIEYDCLTKYFYYTNVKIPEDIKTKFILYCKTI